MNGASERTRIIVLFGDISGFTEFVDSVTNDEIEYDPLMAQFDELVDETARETGYDFTDTGDGFMCTVDLLPGHNCTTAIQVLKNLWKLLKQIEKLFDQHRQNSVSPAGFRIVGAAGYVKRTVKKDGRVVLRGKHINRAHNDLDRARGKGFVCDVSLKNLVSDTQARRHGLKFTVLDKYLWVLKIGR